MQGIFAQLLEHLIALLGKLPLNLRSRIGRVGGFVFSLVPTKDREVARLQLARCFPKENVQRLLRRTYMNVGQVLLENLNLMPFAEDPRFAVKLKNGELLDEALTGKDAWIGLTAHTGTWDIVGLYFATRKLNVLTMGKEAKSPVLQRILSRLRERHGIRTLWRGDEGALKIILSELKAKHVLAAVIDQDTDVGSVYVPFMGFPARCPATLIELGKRERARFATAFIWRENLNQYTIEIEEIKPELSVEEIIAEYNQRLERGIRERPEQWVWFHKRWRSKPDGTRPRTREYIAELKQELAHAAFR